MSVEGSPALSMVYGYRPVERSSFSGEFSGVWDGGSNAWASQPIPAAKFDLPELPKAARVFDHGRLIG